mmetsp:Transcript_7881/g.12828  ORF Transcript_7881/g.12828 Transcript_7881/m.12828 type:complete len:237 (+) Transcript_7881:1369-2079(+)
MLLCQGHEVQTLGVHGAMTPRTSEIRRPLSLQLLLIPIIGVPSVLRKLFCKMTTLILRLLLRFSSSDLQPFPEGMLQLLAFLQCLLSFRGGGLAPLPQSPIDLLLPLLVLVRVLQLRHPPAARRGLCVGLPQHCLQIGHAGLGALQTSSRLRGVQGGGRPLLLAFQSRSCRARALLLRGGDQPLHGLDALGSGPQHCLDARCCVACRINALHAQISRRHHEVQERHILVGARLGNA